MPPVASDVATPMLVITALRLLYTQHAVHTIHAVFMYSWKLYPECFIRPPAEVFIFSRCPFLLFLFDR